MKRLLVTTLILSLAIATAVTAQPPAQGFPGCDRAQMGPGSQGRQMGKMGPGHGPRMGAPGLRAILAHGEELNLTDEQRDKLDGMITTFQMERVDQKAKLEKARINLDALMRDDADEAKVLAGIDEVSRLQGEMKKMHYRHFAAAKRVLTQEQVDKLKSLRRGGRGCVPGMGHGPGQGRGQGPGWDDDDEG